MMGIRGSRAYFRSDPTKGQSSPRGEDALEMPYAPKLSRKNPWPKCNALLGSKVMQGSGVNQGSNCSEMPYGNQICGEIRDQNAKVMQGLTGVKLLRNALWLPNLVGKIPDWKVKHCWVKFHLGVSQDQLEINLLRHAAWQPNLKKRASDGVMHWCSQRSCRSNCLEIPYSYTRVIQ